MVKKLSTNSKCSDCPYPTQSCLPEGPDNANLLIIGEAPGKEEVFNQKPFCGRSGKLVNHILQHVGIDRENVAIGNTVNCRIPNNNSPSDEAIEACSDKRNELIDRVDPNVILCLGAVASKAVLDTNKGINKLRGKVYEKDGRTIIPTFHPASTFHNEDDYVDLVFDFRKLRKIMDGKVFPERNDVSYSIVDSIDKMEQAINYIEDFDVVSCDLETTGLDWNVCEILAWGIGVSEDKVVIIDWKAIEDEDLLKTLLWELFTFSDKPDVIWHNAQYDLKVLNYGYDMDIPVDYDTKYLHRMLDERQFDRGDGRRKLESLCQEWFNWEKWGDMVDYDNMMQEYYENYENFMDYLSYDCRGTYLLWKEFWREINDGLK